MSRRTTMLAIAGLLLLAGVGLVAVGFIGEHNRDVAAERGEPAKEDDDGSSTSFAGLIAVFIAIFAAQQAKKEKTDAEDEANNG